MSTAQDLAFLIALRNPMTEWRQALEKVPEEMREEVREILLQYRANIRGEHSIMDG